MIDDAFALGALERLFAQRLELEFRERLEGVAGRHDVPEGFVAGSARKALLRAQRRPGLEYAAELARELAEDPEVVNHEENYAPDVLIQFAERLERLAEEGA